MNPGKRKDNQSHGTMLRLLGAQQKREVKATQNLSRIVAFFIICWFPLYTINCIMAFCPDCQVSPFLLNFCIILSHLNSVGNPVLYAYHLKDFRAALKNFICRIVLPGRFAAATTVAGKPISLIKDPRSPHKLAQTQLNCRRLLPLQKQQQKQPKKNNLVKMDVTFA